MRVSVSSSKTIALLVLIFAMLGCQSRTKEQFYSLGIEQMGKGNAAGAVVYLKSALEKDQNFFDARHELGKAYITLGNYELAEREFQKLIRQNPSHQGIRLDLARLYNATGKPDMAIREASEYLQLKPGDAAALEMLGTAHAVNGNLPDAESFLLKALQSDPARTSAKLELVRVHAASGRQRDARLLLDAVIKSEPRNVQAYYLLAGLAASNGNKDEALSAYRTIAAIHPDDANALYRVGLVQVEKADMAGARKSAENLVGTFPKRSEGYRLKGLIYYQDKNYPAAITELMHAIKIQPNLEGFYFLGLAFYGKGELESALSQFRRILDVNPSFTRARLLTGMILLQQSRVDDAIAEMEKILATEPKNALAHNLLGNAWMVKGLYDEGMNELNTAIEADPKILDAYFKKGLIQVSRGQDKEAEATFNAAVHVSPSVLNSRLILASYYMKRNNTDKALATLKQGLSGKKSDAILYNNIAGIMFSVRNPAEGLKCLQKAKSIDPHLSASYFNQATYYVASGEYRKALNEYRAILEKEPKNLNAMLRMAALYDFMGRDGDASTMYRKSLGTGKPAAYLALTDFHLRKKRYGKALSVLEDAIDAFPGNAALLEKKGRVYLAERNYAEALKTFDDLESVAAEHGLPLKIKTYVMMKDISRAVQQSRRIITLKPNSAYGYLVLASVYENSNDLRRAIEAAKNGIAADPDSAEAYLVLGNLHEKRNSNKDAMQAFRDALKINRDYVPAYFAQGALLEKMGQKKEAIGRYREALDKSKNYVPALNNLAYLYADGYGSAREALRLIITAYKQDPGNPNILDTLGYALLKNGKNEDSRKALEKAATLLPDNPTVHYHLALSYRETGEVGLAAAQLQKAIKLGNFPEADQARSMLAKLNVAKYGGRSQ